MKLLNSLKYLFINKDERGIKEEIISIKCKAALVFVLFTTIIAFLTTFFVINFSNKTNSFSDDVAVKRINNSSTEINRFISISIASYEKQLSYLETILNNKTPTMSDKKIISDFLDNSKFDKIGYIKEYGYDFSENTSSNSIVDFEASKLTFDLSLDDKYIYFCYKCDSLGNDILGIVGAVDKIELSKLFSSKIYNSSASILLINKDCNILTLASKNYSNIFNTNIIDDFKNFFSSNFDEKEYLKVLNSNENNVIEFSNDSECFDIYTSNIVNYEDIDYSDIGLKLVVMVPKEELVYQIEGVTNLANTTTIIAISILFLVSLFCTILFVLLTIRTKKMKAYDDKTGMLTIGQFKHDSYALLKRTKKEYAFCYINIINFKIINQLHGVAFADKLIKYISNEIDLFFKDKGIYSYFGIDHFELCIEYENDDKLKNILIDFTNIINTKYEINQNNPLLSIGIKTSKYTEGKNTIEDDIFRSKFAEEMLKEDYHNSYISFYDEKMYQLEKENAEYLAAAPKALLDHEFMVYYQLKKNIYNDTWCGAEALVRWNKGGSGLVSPAKFIRLFEEEGFIIELDLYVFEEVCKTLRTVIDNNDKIVPISINLSKKHFANADFINSYIFIIEKYKIPHKYIEFEITEGLIVENVTNFVKFISNIHSQGFLCSMDDFGSGYSSLNVIRELDFDVIKIDSRFFRGTKGFDNESQIIVASIIELCHKLGKKVVAEGIEVEEQVKFLKDNNCDIIQGYYYSKPEPWDNCKEKLNS